MRRRRQGRKRVREKEQGPRVFLDRDGYADSRGQIGNLTHDGISGNESALPPLPPKDGELQKTTGICSEIVTTRYKGTDARSRERGKRIPISHRRRSIVNAIFFCPLPCRGALYFPSKFAELPFSFPIRVRVPCCFRNAFASIHRRSLFPSLFRESHVTECFLRGSCRTQPVAVLGSASSSDPSCYLEARARALVYLTLEIISDGRKEAPRKQVVAVSGQREKSGNRYHRRERGKLEF